MAENNELMGIFNLGVNDVDSHSSEKKESVLYRPSADQGKDGIYRSLIRFIPNPKNPKKSIVRKFVYWLTDTDGNGGYYDSPTTINDKCPVQDLFFKLRNSESALDKKNSDGLKRREIFYSLVQIIKDPHAEELEGKIKVFKYGQKIKQKIDDELKPQFAEATQIFDPFEGKNFELTITKQSGFNNYDSSKFQGNITPITIGGVAMQPNQEDQTKIIEFVTAAPSLSDFEFKPWTDDIRMKVMGILSQYTGSNPGAAMEVIVGDGSQSLASTVTETVSDTPVTETATAEKVAPAVDGNDDGNLTDFLNDLGI